MYEALGPGFTLLSLDGREDTPRHFRQAAERSKIPLALIKDDRQGGRERWEARYVLVRPDQFVAWAAEEEPRDADAVLRLAVGG